MLKLLKDYFGGGFGGPLSLFGSDKLLKDFEKLEEFSEKKIFYLMPYELEVK